MGYYIWAEFFYIAVYSAHAYITLLPVRVTHANETVFSLEILLELIIIRVKMCRLLERTLFHTSGAHCNYQLCFANFS